MTWALPFVPSTISSTNRPQLSCRWQVKYTRTPLGYS